MTQIPSDLYAINHWFTQAQGDEPLLVRVLADTAGLKGWLSRKWHDKFTRSSLEEVLATDAIQSFELAATHLLSQMPQFTGPTTEQEWLQWLNAWQNIHKQKTATEQLNLLPERFDQQAAELAIEKLRQKKQNNHEISITQSL